MGCVIASATANRDLLTMAGDELAVGNKEKTLEILKSVPPDSSEYPESLLESAKLYYADGNFAQFFGLAGYLRKVFGNSDAILLESIALIRHCHYDEARTRLNEILQSGRYHEVVKQWLTVLPKVNLPRSTKEDDTGKAKVFNKIVDWPVSLETRDFPHFNPYDLRRVVHSRCKGGVVR
jgi:hypothetical protein